MLIGDGRDWDEAHIWWFADQADLDALLAEIPDEMISARDDALIDRYTLALAGLFVEPLGSDPEHGPHLIGRRPILGRAHRALESHGAGEQSPASSASESPVLRPRIDRADP